jgi:hypothetical protein
VQRIEVNMPKGIDLRPRLASIVAVTAVAACALVGMAAPAKAWWPGYYAPWPYYGPPAYYPPPPAYYPPPPAAYAPPQAAAPSTAAITYTNRPSFKNAAGQTCRQFTSTSFGGQPTYGTACRDSDGQWRVTN